MTAPAVETLRVDLVTWSGDTATLAARLQMPESELLARLRRIAKADKNRLAVDVRLANTGLALSALARLLNFKEAET